jgi:hypothetical protein
MMRLPVRCLPLIACAALAACGGNNTGSPVAVPGADTTARSRVLDAGAAVLQDKQPLDAINSYLDGFHFYSGNMQGQMEAHHYCAMLNEDVTQCVIYDGNTGQAKLMGVEYIISRKLFDTLAADEKHLWHSHVHEVRSGQLIAPGIPEAAEHELMRKIAGTYGKTWHTWHTDQQHALPLGPPMLMMGFTKDGQADEAMVADRDRRFGVSSMENRRRRADIEYPPVDSSADAWQQGIAIQIQATTVRGAPPADR